MENETKFKYIYVEIKVDENADFDIDRILRTDIAYKEMEKCEKFDVIEKCNRTCYGQL